MERRRRHGHGIDVPEQPCFQQRLERVERWPCYGHELYVRGCHCVQRRLECVEHRQSDLYDLYVPGCCKLQRRPERVERVYGNSYACQPCRQTAAPQWQTVAAIISSGRRLVGGLDAAFVLHAEYEDRICPRRYWCYGHEVKAAIDAINMK